MIPEEQSRRLPACANSKEEISTSAAAVLIAAFFFATSLYIASHRLFWFDEIFTVLFARLPRISAIWHALLTGADLQPLPFYLVIRASESIFGRSEFAARLPSAISVAIGLLVTFDCTRRLTSGIYGLAAVAVLACSFLPFYGSEARPYGMFFLLSAMMLWAWVHTPETRKGSIFLFGSLAFAASLVHVYAVFCLVPYAVSDLLARRRPSARLLSGFIGIALGLSIIAPQWLTGRRITSRALWWAAPTFNRLHSVMDRFFPYGLFLLAVLVILAVVLDRRKKIAVTPMDDPERLGWLFLLIPVAGYAAAVVATNSFHERYFIGTMPGVAVAFACMLERHFAARRIVIFAFVLASLAFGIRRQADTAVHAPSSRLAERASLAIALEDTLAREGRRYTAVSDPELNWIEGWFYSRHPERYVSIGGPDALCRPMSRFYPSLTCWTLDELKAHARETAVVLSISEVESTRRDGFRVTVRQARPLYIFYLDPPGER